LNVANIETIKTLSKMNTRKIGLSPELNDFKLNGLMNNINNNNYTFNLELLVYGLVEIMVMKYCPLNALINKDKGCNVCQNKKQYSLKGNNGEFYPIINNNCLAKLLYSKKIDLTDKIDYYKTLGITNFRFDLYNETTSEIEALLIALNLL